MSRRDQTQQALSRIIELAQSALRASQGPHSNGHGHTDDAHDDGDDSGAPAITCTPRVLPLRLQVDAANVARRTNPANAPLFGATAGAFGDMPLDPLQIAVLTAKYWGSPARKLTVSFMEATDAALRNRILSHMNAWACGISFVYTQGVGQVRISRGGSGYWSYLGTDVLLIPKNRPTMNLQGFTMNTPESEYKRVVRHETGHTLGCPHEHMRKALVDRIDKNKAYAYFWQTQGWDKATVDQQVLTPLNEGSIMGTPPDQTSIMCYQLPGSITKNGSPILGGIDINATDRTFITKLYPKPGASAHQAASYSEPTGASFAMHDDADAEPTDGIPDWDPSEDVQLDDVEIPA